MKAERQTTYRIAQKQHQQALRQGVLDDASNLLMKEGPAALSMRRIAKLVGCSTMTLYTLFGNKQGVVDQLYLRGFELLRQALESVPHTGAPLDYVWALCYAYRQFAMDNSSYYAIMFANPVPEYTPPEASRQTGEKGFILLVQAVQGCRVVSPITQAESWDIARMIWATLHGHVSLALAKHFDEVTLPASLLERSLKTIFDTLLVDEESAV
ncbi:MAG: TetR/AcrR family transcriptional regulator [Phormidesmis sp.]